MRWTEAHFMGSEEKIMVMGLGRGHHQIGELYWVGTWKWYGADDFEFPSLTDFG
jgi:hypothetical protein